MQAPRTSRKPAPSCPLATSRKPLTPSPSTLALARERV